MQIHSIFEKYPCPPPNYPLSKHATNGFSRCPSIAQITSYLLISLSIAIYFSCIISLHFNIALLVLYAVLGTIPVMTSLLATVCDPTDRVVYYYKWSLHDKNTTFAPDYSKVLFCNFCDSYCLSTSKHCRSCNRCVNDFDHHCIWFNNCVGQRNYKYFFISILSTFAYLIVVIVHVAINSAYVDYSQSSVLIKIILSWITAALLGIFAFLLFNLIVLHIHLLLTGQTTFMFLQLICLKEGRLFKFRIISTEVMGKKIYDHIQKLAQKIIIKSNSNRSESKHDKKSDCSSCFGSNNKKQNLFKKGVKKGYKNKRTHSQIQIIKSLLTNKKGHLATKATIPQNKTPADDEDLNQFMQRQQKNTGVEMEDIQNKFIIECTSPQFCKITSLKQIL